MVGHVAGYEGVDFGSDADPCGLALKGLGCASFEDVHGVVQVSERHGGKEGGEGAADLVGLVDGFC